MSYFRGGFQDKWPVSRLNSACLPHHPFSQRSAVPARGFFGLPGEPVPCFHPLSIGEGWSAGRRPGSLAIGSLRPALRSAGLTRRDSWTQGLEGVGVPWRAGLLRGSPGASRRSIAARVVGGRTLRSLQASRSTTPEAEQGMAVVQGREKKRRVIRIGV